MTFDELTYFKMWMAPASKPIKHKMPWAVAGTYRGKPGGFVIRSYWKIRIEDLRGF